MRREWTRHRRNKLPLALVALVGMMLIATVVVHGIQHRALAEAQAHWQQTSDELWASQPDRHPHRVAHYGHVVVRPQPALSFMAPGVTAHVGNYLFLEAHRQNSSSIRAAAVAPATLKLGFPSPVGLLLTFWPLLLIVLGYSAFSHEWESGRLFWLASMGVSAWRLALGKAAVFAGYTLAVLAAVGLTGAFWLGFHGQLDGAALTGLAAQLTVLGGYNGGWIVLILFVSFHSRDSNQSLYRLLALWLLLVVLVPRLAGEVARFQYPTPDRATFETALAEAVHAVGDAHNPNDPYFSDFRAQTLARYGVDSIDALPVNWNGLVMVEGERITSELFQEHFGRITAQFEGQDRCLGWFSWVSPVLAVRQICQTVAGTDRGGSAHFEAAAEAFRFALIQKLNHLHGHEIKRENDRGQKVSARHWRDMALFDYQPPPPQTPDARFLAGGLVWLVLAALMLAGFRRKEVLR
ncbi:DUF3526 domain-containing protein [Acanthopleuribacter pedis]|uniref:DUF3526 domain-containing protein n=1 Tax=Acanthopleuribacter pedis TaxID=442870 RepID=A0A8J7U5P5_9BACT|nr:DUF3526 domain-containing protein [Acanthopleuribacter pedis]MBO1321932.1 DUF3526 domain-containing protein [Acanthopleuribacter pedis]